ncbi:MAG: NAAT family transporter, partial [Burkholderiales bacterium]|nr:NAAT family transporter [Burkholderiales bacterium]
MEILINSFVVLFVVIDPIGVALVFNTLTRDTEVEHQRRTALRGVALATGILLVFFLIGDALLQRLGISIPAMRIAGGTLLFLLAIDMIFARQSGLRSTTRREQHEAEHKEDVSVFPLAFPLIAGPGALTTVLLMASSSTGAWVFVGMIAVSLVVLSYALVSLLFAPNIMRILGETGTNVISRLLGLILAAL